MQKNHRMGWRPLSGYNHDLNLAVIQLEHPIYQPVAYEVEVVGYGEIIGGTRDGPGVGHVISIAN